MAVILIVDDEPAILAALSAALSDAGHEVVTAINGQQGIEKLEIYRPDAILSDWMMPVMGGEQMLRQIRRNEDLRRIPFIAMSAIPLLASLPLDGRLQKPFSVRTLLDLLENALSACRQPDLRTVSEPSL